MNLLQFNAHELSAYRAAPVDSQGRLPVLDLDPYFQGSTHIPYFIRVKGHIAGFVLLADMTSDQFEVAEFFLIHQYRGMGLGGDAAELLFDTHPGHWRVPVLEGNENARRFWRAVVRRLTLRRYEESVLTRGFLFEFLFPPDLRGALPGSYREKELVAD